MRVWSCFLGLQQIKYAEHFLDLDAAHQLESILRSTSRSVRLMRPLKLLRTIPSIRVLLSTLLGSIGSLGGIMTVAMFFFLIFAILGVTLWKGKVHFRCYLTEFPENGEWELLPDFFELCSDVNSCPVDPVKSFCGSRFIQAQNGTTFNNPDLWIDTDFEEFNYGITNFDNVGSAFIAIF
jgi:hypothetical protein